MVLWSPLVPSTAADLRTTLKLPSPNLGEGDESVGRVWMGRPFCTNSWLANTYIYGISRLAYLFAFELEHLILFNNCANGVILNSSNVSIE